MPLTKKEREELEKLYLTHKEKIFTVRLIDRDKAVALFTEMCENDKCLSKDEILIALNSLPIIEV